MRLGLWLTCLFVIATFLRPQELVPELAAYNIMDILGGLALLATVVDILSGARPRLWQAPVVLLVGFVLWTAFSVVAALRWFGGAALAFQSLSINMFIFTLTVLHGSELSRSRAIRRAAIFALLLTVGLGLRAYYFGPRADQFVMLQRAGAEPPEEPDPVAVEDGSPSAPTHTYRRRLRALGFLNDPNDLAQVLVATLPLILLAWRPGRHLANLFLAVGPAMVAVWAILLTRSRGGLVALAALVYLAAIGRLRPGWARLFQATGLLGLLAILVAFFRLSGDESAQGRLEAWSTGIQLLKQSPIWGVGYANFVDYHDIVAHNSFVHCFSETGLVGYFLWLGALVATLWRLQTTGSLEASDSADPRERELARWAIALRLSLLSFLVGAMFLSRTYSVSLFFFVGLAAALSGAASRTLSGDRHRSMPVSTLLGVTGVLVGVSIATTYVVVRLGR